MTNPKRLQNTLLLVVTIIGCSVSNDTAASASDVTPSSNRPGTAEPTNAVEAGVKRSALDAEVEEKYQRWKQNLSPEQRAWEAVLEANLGGYYLPLYKADKARGIPTVWDFTADDPKLPRVLLIGDSISRGYTLSVRARLAGKANVHRAPENCGQVANGLKKLDIWLGSRKWDVIHFNFGIHDRNTPLEDYAKRLEQFHQRLKSTGAKLVWASTIPLPLQSSYGSNAAIVERNEAASAIMGKNGTPIDDLYSYILPQISQYQKTNDVHFSETGYDFLGAHVAQEIGRLLSH